MTLLTLLAHFRTNYVNCAICAMSFFHSFLDHLTQASLVIGYIFLIHSLVIALLITYLLPIYYLSILDFSHDHLAIISRPSCDHYGRHTYVPHLYAQKSGNPL